MLRTSHLRWALLGLFVTPAAVAGLMRAGASTCETPVAHLDGYRPRASAARRATSGLPAAARATASPAPGPKQSASLAPRVATSAPAVLAPGSKPPSLPPAGFTQSLVPPATSLAFPLSSAEIWPALSRAAEVLDAALVPITTGLRILEPTPMGAARFVAGASAASNAAALETLSPPEPWSAAHRGPATRVLAELSVPTGPRPPVALRTSDDPTWRSLDSRLYRMRTIAFNGGFEVGISGFVKFTAGAYEMENDPVDRTSRSFSLDAARLNLVGETDDMRLFVSLAAEETLGGGFIAKDGVGGELQLLDAYAQFELADWVELQVGNFRSPVLFSSGIDDNELLFINRTYSSLFWQERDVGALAHGQIANRFDWWVAVQNGVDGAADNLAATVRGSWRVFGEGEAPRREGAYDADLGQTLYLGAAYHDDATFPDADVVAADAFYTYDRLSLSAELSEYDSGLLNHRQWSATGAYMIVPETWEVAMRYEDFGDRAGDLIQLALNRYLDDFHSRVQLVVGRFEHLGGGDEVNRIELGVVVSI